MCKNEHVNAVAFATFKTDAAFHPYSIRQLPNIVSSRFDLSSYTLCVKMQGQCANMKIAMLLQCIRIDERTTLSMIQPITKQ